MNEPRRAAILAIVAAFALVILGGLVTLGFRMTTPGTSPWIRERRTTTVSRPAMEQELRALKRGMAAADVEKAMGRPDSTSRTGPFTTWCYTSHDRYEVKRFLLGILPMGSGGGSQSFTAPLVFHDGVLVSAPYGIPMERRLSGEFARLDGATANALFKVARGPSAGRSIHDQLCAIAPGNSTAADVERLLGAPDVIRRRGALCVWRWQLAYSSGGTAMAWSPEVRFRDDVVIEMPYALLSEEEAKEFEGWEHWK